MEKRYKIAVMTSGGDAPGMNAAVRAVVRAGLDNDMDVLGIMNGFSGLLEKDVVELNARSVADIIARGGTVLKTARCMEMMTEEGQTKAANICKELDIKAIVIIGGDGSLTGGTKLMAHGINIIGIPATIDLDLPSSDYTIGFDTAVNTCLDAALKIRDTSSSHSRSSLIEVMGRGSGALALWCALITGAEDAIIPEKEVKGTDYLVNLIKEAKARGKKNNLFIVAEGVKEQLGDTNDLAKEIEKQTGIETRATILGHIQRGGQPTAVDIKHASMMGYEAIDLIKKGEENRIVIYKDGAYTSIDLLEGLDKEKVPYNDKFYQVMKTLSI